MNKTQNNIQKIYSRKRMALPIFKRRNKNQKRFKIIGFFFVLFVISYTIFVLIWRYINPIFETLCVDKAKTEATVITNEETSKLLDKYDWEHFFNIQKDEKGNIQMINADILIVNKFTSDVALNIQNRLEQNENNKISINLGSISGIKIFSGIGPEIYVSIKSSGNVKTNLKSEFVSKGVNQTLHRVYLEIKTNISILTSFDTIETVVENQVLIAEHIIIGEIPPYYYNINGLIKENET